MRVTKVNECVEYVWVDNVMYTIDSDQNFLINGEVVLDGELSISGCIVDSVWVFDESNMETFVFVNKTQTRRITKFGIVLRQKIDVNKYLVGVNTEDDFSTGIFDISSFELESEFKAIGLNGVYLLVDKNHFVSRNKSSIALFDFSNNLKWQHSFSDLTNSDRSILHSRILHVSGKLFFVVDGNVNKGLFVLDSTTGVVLKKFGDLCFEIFQDDNYIYTTRYENILCRINIQSLELEEWDCNTLIKENDFDNIHDHRSIVFESQFYFSQSLSGNIAKLGVLDWKKDGLIYKYDFDPNNGAVKSIQVNKQRTFVQTQDNTLHVFEKE